MARQLGGGTTPSAADPAYLRKIAGAAALVQAIRQYGHLAVQIDPLGSPPPGAAELKPEFHGITEADLATIPGAALGFDADATAADVVARLRGVYCATIGFEFEHIERDAEREWFRRVIEDGEMRRTLTDEEKRARPAPPHRSRRARALPRPRVPGLQALLDRRERHPRADARRRDRRRPRGMARVRSIMAMAHRGRINVLAHMLGKPYATIFEEFEGKHAATNAVSDTGDVKYHLGADTDRERKVGEPRARRR